MPDEAPYGRALRDADFLRRFAARYTGELDPLEALRRYAESGGSVAVGDEVAEALYGGSVDDRERQRLVDALVAKREDEAKVHDALRAVRMDDSLSPATSAGRSQRFSRPRDRTMLIIGALVFVGIGIAIGRSLPAAPGPVHPIASRLSPSRELPADITFDNRDGQQALLTVRSSTDPRTVVADLPPVTGGYDMGTACLASSRRPAVVPVDTVLLFSASGRQLAHRVIVCDGDERRFHALAPVDATETVRLVIDVDTDTVGAAWVTLDPAAG